MIKDFITTELFFLFLPTTSNIIKTIDSYKDFSNMFWFYYQFENTLCTDRFGYGNKYLPFNGYKEPLAKEPSFDFDKSFEWCVQKRVQEYIELSKKENKKIVVSCSGGVDSTMVVCAFLLYGLEKENLLVLYSDTSYEEYPWFFDHLKKENIQTFQFTQKNVAIVYGAYSKNHILIMGNAGDQLYGSHINVDYPEWFHKDYKDFIRFKGGNDKTIEQMEDIADHYKIELKETSQYMWWMNFSVKHTKVCHAENLEIHVHDKFHAFFNTDYFDSWCCSNLDRITLSLPTVPKYYRLEEKAIIYQYTKDDDYINTKSKTKPTYWVFNPFTKYKISYLTIEGINTVNLDEFDINALLNTEK